MRRLGLGGEHGMVIHGSFSFFFSRFSSFVCSARVLLFRFLFFISSSFSFISAWIGDGGWDDER